MPKKIEIGVDELVEARKDISDDNGVLYKAHVAPRSWDSEERSAVFTISAEVEDSYRDIVVQSGIDLESRFNKNPVALFGHRSWDMPIGSWTDIKTVRSSPKRTEGKLMFSPEGTDEMADRVASNVAAGTLRAASIGFMPKAAEKILDEEGNWTYGYKFNEVELYEVSVVSIPAVRQAIVRGASPTAEDIVSPEVIEEFLEHLKANPGLVKMINRSLYEDVYREITGKKHSVDTLTIKADLDPEGHIKVFRGLVERAEAAVKTLTEVDVPEEAEPEVPPFDEEKFTKDMEQAADELLAPFEEKAEALPEEHKSIVQRVLDRVRSAFAPTEPEIEEPEKASDETKAALKRAVEELEARHKAA